MELEKNTKREALVKAMENKRLRIETEEAEVQRLLSISRDKLNNGYSDGWLRFIIW
jgi:hypothetical protein